MNETPQLQNSSSKMHPLKAPLVFTAISAVVFIILGVFGVLFLNKQGSLFVSPNKEGFEKFSSEAELRDYLSNAQQNLSFSSFGGLGAGVARDLAVQETLLAPQAAPSIDTGKVDRVSSTNVQVAGLDEPDIVKTNGKTIFFSPENYFYPVMGGPEPLILEDRIGITTPNTFPAPSMPRTKVINAIPPESIALTSEIDKSGNLLLSDNNLMVIANDRITAFDTTSSPKETWSYQFDENFTYQTARLMNGKVYLVTTRYADYSLPCPMPLLKGEESLTIACTDIYRPIRPVSSNTVYSVIKLNPATGSVEDSITFMGDSGSSVIYMSENAIYAAFVSFPSPIDFMANFLAENRDLLGDDVVNRVGNLRSIDISNESKVNELSIITQRYLSSLGNDERARIESELANRMDDYIKKHGRELQVSSLVKIGTASLDVAATGEVPGSPLNQFSLDEWNGNLRIATTVSPNSMFGSGESANDLYVLGNNLEIIGKIQDLALGERIFSARFIKDQAYLVTFKQIDPFFVIDLANPTNPKVTGELKIPGFSSYLHPLSDNKILGVGQENGQTKLSVFDVANPAAPTETDKYTLSEYYSEVQNNHHAFLSDPENQVFFMPAGSSGYIFSWRDGLTLERVVSNITAKRALYINNNLYIVGENKIVVVNESTWEDVSSLEF